MSETGERGDLVVNIGKNSCQITAHFKVSKIVFCHNGYK